MTTTTPASRRAAPPTPAAVIPTASVQPLMAGFHDANMASYYLRVGNLCAARRKLVRALDSVNEAIEGSAA